MPSRLSDDQIEEQILDATDRTLAHCGYENLDLGLVAHEARIKDEILRVHFPSKQNLLLAHIDRIVRRVIQRLRDIARGDAEPGEKIRRMLLFRVMARFEGVQHYSHSLKDVLRDLRSDLLERREYYFKAEARVFVEVLEEGRKAKVFRVADCSETAKALIVATNAILPFNLTDRDLGDRFALEETATHLAELLISGLAQNNLPAGKKAA